MSVPFTPEPPPAALPTALPTALSSPRVEGPVPEDRELHAILGSDTALSGRLSFAGRVRIEGQVEGELLGGELVVIAAGARIHGTVSARHVLVLGGEVHANITATDSIELCVPAVVTGDLRAPEIFLERGVSFSGKCTMGSELEGPS